MTEPGTPPALEIGGRHRVTIVDLAFGGEGVARIGELVVFIPFVIPGEEVEIELTELKKSFARARLVAVERASPSRVEPRCRYFGDCGGCQYQHLAYAEQLRFKERQIAELLRRVGKLPGLRVEPIRASPREYAYRNRVMIRSQWNRVKQGLEIGFIRHDNRMVVDIEECAIAEPQVNEGIREARRRPPPKGGIKVVVRQYPEGWEVPPDSFFQNNTFLLPELVGAVREFVREQGSRFLIDLYCGVGFFAIELAGQVERFAGVEFDRRAVQAARQNAERRGLTHGEFLDGRAEHLLPRLIESFPPAETTVVIDPPRTGCAPETIELLRAQRPSQIIYVSCHPATLARDLQALCGDGAYRVERVRPFDMFPQTQHVECVADLRAAEVLAAGQPD